MLIAIWSVEDLQRDDSITCHYFVHNWTLFSFFFAYHADHGTNNIPKHPLNSGLFTHKLLWIIEFNNSVVVKYSWKLSPAGQLSGFLAAYPCWQLSMRGAWPAADNTVGAFVPSSNEDSNRKQLYFWINLTFHQFIIHVFSFISMATVLNRSMLERKDIHNLVTEWWWCDFNLPLCDNHPSRVWPSLRVYTSLSI